MNEDIRCLVDEYELHKLDQLRWELSKKEEEKMSFHRGTCYGLEMALLWMGVSNDTLDDICQKAGQRVWEEFKGEY